MGGGRKLTLFAYIYCVFILFFISLEIVGESFATYLIKRPL